MNYYGKIVSEIIPAKKIYQFLQEALKKSQKINRLEDLIILKMTISNILTELMERLKGLRDKR
jgi:hypothetical protein